MSNFPYDEYYDDDDKVDDCEAEMGNWLDECQLEDTDCPLVGSERCDFECPFNRWTFDKEDEPDIDDSADRFTDWDDESNSLGQMDEIPF